MLPRSSGRPTVIFGRARSDESPSSDQPDGRGLNVEKPQLPPRGWGSPASTEEADAALWRDRKERPGDGSSLPPSGEIRPCAD